MSVTINGVELSWVEQASLAMQLGMPIAPGRYFYDHESGAWGYEGGPTQGYLPPALPLPRRATAPSAKAGDPTATSTVVINGVALSSEQLAALAARFGVGIQPGRYWYDPLCGAWGQEGGPTRGQVHPGLELGGPLRAEASGGGQGTLSGVFVNGRELHPQDVQVLSRLGPVPPGRYWLDARGVGGIEGGPPLFDLSQLARQAGGGGGGPWSHASRNADGSSTYVGGDGEGFFYLQSKDGGVIIG